MARKKTKVKAAPRKRTTGRKTRRKKTAKRRRRSWTKRIFLALLVTVLIGAASVVGYAAWLDGSVRAQFEGKRWAIPARIYARPLELYEGIDLSADELARELDASGYHRTKRLDRAGSYVRKGETFQVSMRSFEFPDGAEPAREVTLRFSAKRLASIQAAKKPLALARMDPALFGRIYPTHQEDRILVRLDEVPQLFVKSLVAVEDRGYFEHHGIQPRAIARAIWQNIRAGRAVQGGSTLTQQLAKNFFLTQERSLRRKVNDAIIAVLLELHYSKEEILEAYINEVFLGQEGSRSINGFGLAAQFYFGRELRELQLPEIALMVAMVRGASYYNPRRNPERALKRRNLMLDVLSNRGVVSKRQAKEAKAAPLGVSQSAPRGASKYPAFFDLVRRQLQRDYREEDLRSEGLRVFTTLDPQLQHTAEESLAAKLAALEKAGKVPKGELQGAVVLTSAQSGEILAAVGGRDVRASGFNRALDARRPVGSLLKPAVYLAALEQAPDYTLMSRLYDEPLTMEGARGEPWSPQNYDKQFHGEVPLHLALSKSYNIATVRLGMEVGLERVISVLKRLGVDRKISPYPSMLLGAVDMSPLQITQMYQTFASGGFRTPLRAIRDVTDARGKSLTRYGLSVEQAFEPVPVYLTNTVLQEVLRSGTGRSAYKRLSPALTLAGKTGTTDDLRDSWFAGFDSNYLSVVWLGRDDNSPVGLTGSSGALQVWTELMARLGPVALRPAVPEGVEWHWTDLATYQRTDADCPGAGPMPYAVAAMPQYFPCGYVQVNSDLDQERAWQAEQRANRDTQQPLPTAPPGAGGERKGGVGGIIDGVVRRLGDIFR